VYKVDKDINKYLKTFIEEWVNLRRHLHNHDYIESTIETYQVVQMLINQDFDKAKKLMNHLSVDKHRIENMLESSKGCGITFVALSYPEIANFNVFYYKEKNEDLSGLIKKVYEIDSNEIEYQSVAETIEMYECLKLTIQNEEMYDDISSEIALLCVVDDFIEVARSVNNNMQETLANHKAAMSAEKQRAKRKMTASNYSNFCYKRNNRYNRMCENFYTNINLLIDIYEN